MPLLDELFARELFKSKRQLSALLGRAPNFVCESKGYFTATDLVELRLQLLAIGGHDDLVSCVTDLLLSTWKNPS